MQWNDTLFSFYEQLPKKDKEPWLFERTACDTSFHYFLISIIDPCFGTETPPASKDIHKPTSDFWQSPHFKRKATYKPRDWRKSTYYTMGSGLWEYLQNNEHRILFASQKEKRPSDWLLWIEKQVLNNKRLRWVYPELQSITPAWKNDHKFSSTQCELPSKFVYPDPTFQVIGITGGAHGGHHTIIYCDDLVGEKGMESELVMLDACRWFDNVEELLVERNPNKPNASEVRVVGTHWAKGDLGHYIQQKYPQYIWHVTPALKDSSLKNQPHVKWIQNPNVGEFESNWPEAHDTQGYLDDMNNPEREMVFWSQLMNNPEGGGGGINKFSTEWIRYFYFEKREDGIYIICEDDKEEFKLAGIPLYGIIDPGGFAETKMITKGSNNAILIGGQAPNSIKKFVVFTYAGKMREPSVFRNMVLDKHEEFAPRAWRIEIFGQQGYILRDIKEEAFKKKKTINIWECPQDSCGFRTTDVHATAKDLRMQSILPALEQGEIFLHRSMKKLIAEMNAYPNIIGGCDLLDCLGWLNQLYWTRRESNYIELEYRKQRQKHLQERESLTGYGGGYG